MGYVEGKSLLHTLNPLLKLWGLVVVTVSVLISPDWALNLLVLVCVVAGFLLSGTRPLLSRRRVLSVLTFSLFLILLQVVITPNGPVLFYVLPGPSLPVTVPGIERGVIVTTRFLVVILSSMLFTAVTDPSLLAHSLTRVGVSYRHAFMLVIALRFLPLFGSENEIVRLAQRSRGITIQVGSVSKILRTVRYTFFPLLVSALNRVEALSISMDGRGFGRAPTRTYLRQAQWRLRDTLTGVVMTAHLLIVTLVALGAVPPLSHVIWGD